MPCCVLVLLLLMATAACGQNGRHGGDDVVLAPPEIVAVPAPPVKLVPAFGKLRFERPVDVRQAPGDERSFYVVEQEGRISRLLPGIAGWVATPFLDIHERVTREGNEEGLLGLDFDPHFDQPGHPHHGAFYVNYSVNPGPLSRLSRFFVPAGSAQADPASEQVLLEIEQPYRNHNGGGLLFGPDGFLYYSLGDGGSRADPQQNAQNTQVLLGKMLRLDVAPRQDGKPYGIPADNPFADGQGGRPEIFAWGLRNVWRFSFDRKTSELWGGDVGQDKYEFVDVIRRGGRYGWDLLEGFHRFELPPGTEPPADLVPPVFEYPHPGVAAAPAGASVGEGLSITGGCVYRGRAIPALSGFYVFGDYGTQLLWAIRRLPDGRVEHMTLLKDAGLVTSFTETRDGELLVVDHRGTLFRLAPGEPSGVPDAAQATGEAPSPSEPPASLPSRAPADPAAPKGGG